MFNFKVDYLQNDKKGLKYNLVCFNNLLSAKKNCLLFFNKSKVKSSTCVSLKAELLLLKHLLKSYYSFYLL